MSEYTTANTHELCHQIGVLKRRIAELEAWNKALQDACEILRKERIEKLYLERFRHTIVDKGNI